jgi:hypothetical protein
MRPANSSFEEEDDDFGNGLRERRETLDLRMIISTAQMMGNPDLNHTYHDSNAEQFLNHLDRDIAIAFYRN